jgi:S-adenosylmethionine hydrolase
MAKRIFMFRLKKLHSVIACMAALLLMMGSVAKAQSAAPTNIVLMTDFGHVDDAVAICKGVMVSIAPQARIYDLTQDVIPFNILEGARFLAGTAPYYPKGTVFVGVVDPGVGSTRKPIVALTRRGQYFVVPDNGLLTLFGGQDEVIAAREITNRDWMIGARLSSTFHGRDIFSPVGGHLAAGEDWTQVGPAIELGSIVRLNIVRPTINEQGLKASVIDTDGPFGNLVTNVQREDFAKLGYALGDTVPVTLDGKHYEFPFVKTFSDVALGAPLFFIDSRGRLSLALNQGSFAQKYAVKPPVEFVIAHKK